MHVADGETSARALMVVRVFFLFLGRGGGGAIMVYTIIMKGPQGNTISTQNPRPKTLNPYSTYLSYS